MKRIPHFPLLIFIFCIIIGNMRTFEYEDLRVSILFLVLVLVLDGKYRVYINNV